MKSIIIKCFPIQNIYKVPLPYARKEDSILQKSILDPLMYNMAQDIVHFSVSQHQSDMLREDTLVITGCRKESNLIDDHDFGYPSTGVGNGMSQN